MNSDKPEFFQTVYGINSVNNPKLIENLLADALYCIRVQCAYYKHKWQRGVNSMKGLVMAQVGGNTQNAPLVNKFMIAEPLLRDAIYGNSRPAIISALNACSFAIDPSKPGGVAKKSLLLDGYRRYWDFTLPESDLVFGLRK